MAGDRHGVRGPSQPHDGAARIRARRRFVIEIVAGRDAERSGARATGRTIARDANGLQAHAPILKRLTLTRAVEPRIVGKHKVHE